MSDNYQIYTHLAIVVVWFVFLFNLPLNAEDLYLNSAVGSSGGGTNWNVAWKTPANIVWGTGAGKLSAGDTLWMRGGNYSNFVISGSGTAGNPIYIKRVRSTNATPVAATGWDNSFDDTVLIFGMSCNSPGNGNYLVVDGQIPYGGIKFTNNNAGFTNAAETLGAQDTYTVDFNASGANNITIINFDNCGRGFANQQWGQYTNAGEPAAEGRCFSFNNNTGTQATNLYIGYGHIHHMPTLYLIYGYNNVTQEFNLYNDNQCQNTATVHPNVGVLSGVTNLYFLNNVVSNWTAEGDMYTPSAGLRPVGTAYYVGNRWINSIPGSSRVLETQNTTNGPVHFWNNSVCSNAFGVRQGGISGGAWHSGSSSTNNASQFCSVSFGNNNIGNNITNLTGASFTDALLRIDTNSVLFNAGVPLPSQFSVDADGNTRGADGLWDVGALEAQGGAADTTDPSITITSPTSGTTYGTSTALVNIGGTASDNILVASVTWSNDRGGSGACSGTTSWSKSGIVLASGVNVLTVTGLDGAGNTGTDTLTVTYTPDNVTLKAPFKFEVSQ